MIKKILALLFILCSAANLPASECVPTEQNETITTNDNNATYALLIGMHKNNTLTAENLSMLTKTQSVEDILEILTTQKEDLQNKVDSEKLNRAATSMFNRVGKKWAGVLVAPFAIAQTFGVTYKYLLHPANKNAWKLFNNLKPEEQTYTKTFTETINQTVKATWTENISKAPNWTNKQLKFGMQCTAFALGTLVALNYAQQLYQYYTHINNYENEINRIDTIIETINALHIA